MAVSFVTGSGLFYLFSTLSRWCHLQLPGQLPGQRWLLGGDGGLWGGCSPPIPGRSLSPGCPSPGAGEGGWEAPYTHPTTPPGWGPLPGPCPKNLAKPPLLLLNPRNVSQETLTKRTALLPWQGTERSCGGCLGGLGGSSSGGPTRPHPLAFKGPRGPARTGHR